MCTVLVSLKASILHSAHFPLKHSSTIVPLLSTIVPLLSTIVPLHSTIVPLLSFIVSFLIPLRTYIFIPSLLPPSPSFLLLRTDIEQCADMSSGLFNACHSNNMEEAMRLLSTASYADVNYRYEVLVDMKCINIQ